LSLSALGSPPPSYIRWILTTPPQSVVTAWADALAVNTSITELNLARNHINANDVTILAPAISNMKVVSSLDLSNNDIGQQQVRPVYTMGY
jgi:hypothetical protein